MYLLALTVGLCIVYGAFLFFFPVFFGQTRAGASRGSFSSVVIIAVSSLFTYVLCAVIPDPAWSNRIQHALGGGVIAFLVCFFAARDSTVQMNRFQFVVFSSLIVTTLGVANEMFEYMLQANRIAWFAETPEDTWLDLVSNTVGIIVAAAVFTPFIARKTK